MYTIYSSVLAWTNTAYLPWNSCYVEVAESVVIQSEESVSHGFQLIWRTEEVRPTIHPPVVKCQRPRQDPDNMSTVQALPVSLDRVNQKSAPLVWFSWMANFRNHFRKDFNTGSFEEYCVLCVFCKANLQYLCLGERFSIKKNPHS